VQLDEDFARWREDPVTRLVFKALIAAEGQQKAAWEAASWGGGMVRDEELGALLRELRVRADCYRALIDLDADDIRQWLGMTDEQ